MTDPPRAGLAAGSTNNSVLSHEMFETLTDPDGSGWLNISSNSLFGEEIADECSFVTFDAFGAYFDPPPVRLNGKWYAVQPEYFNRSHSCTVSRGGDD